MPDQKWIPEEVLEYGRSATGPATLGIGHDARTCTNDMCS